MKNTSQPFFSLPVLEADTFEFMSSLSVMSPTETETVATVQVVAEEDLEQWQKDLQRDGFAVVKGAVSSEVANTCAENMYSWLEGL